MRKPCLALVVSLLFCAAAHADPAEIAKIKGFVDQAQKKDAFLIARTAAVDELGQFKSKDPETLLYLRGVFKTLLNSPAVKDYELNFFRLHVIQAIGSIGSDLSPLATDLPQYVGGEQILNDAIADALKKIRPAATTAPPTPPASGHAADITKYLGQLTDKTVATADRLTASGGLAKFLSAGDKGDVTAILDLKTGLPAAIANADSSTRMLAAKLAKPAFDATKVLDAATVTSVKAAYLAGLAKMLVPANVSEFVEAAQAVAAIGPPDAAIDSIQTALKSALTPPADPTKPTDPAVILEAQTALTIITAKP